MGGNPAWMETSDGGSLNVMTFPLEIAEIWTSVLLSAEAMKKVAVSGLVLSASVFFFFFSSGHPSVTYLKIPPFLKFPQNPFFNGVKRIPNEKKVSGESWEH